MVEGMRITTTVEVGNRVVVERVTAPDTRKGWRDAANEMICRLELSTFGPPGPVDAMTNEDRPISFTS